MKPSWRGILKKRYVYVLLFGIPGLFVAGILSIILFGAVVGVLWLYIFGDNPWPTSSEGIISSLFVLVFLVLWTISILLGYVIGKRLEKEPALNRTHVMISTGLTIIFLLLVVLQQWSAGTLGPKSDSPLCSDFCTAHGYPGSGMLPLTSGDRTCSCYDNSGDQVLEVPLDSIDPDILK